MFKFTVLIWCLIQSISSICAFLIPTWANNYYVKGTFSAPEVGVEQPFDVWYAADAKKARIDYFHGMTKTYMTLDEHRYGTEYNLFPMTNQTHRNVNVCVKKNGSSRDRIELQPALYPVEDMFKFVGYINQAGEKIQKWVRLEMAYGRPVSFIYLIKCREDLIDIICRPKCTPIRLEMYGRDLLMHNNAGIYFIDYHMYTPNGAKPHTVFPPYTGCQSSDDFFGSASFSQNSLRAYLPSLSEIVKEDRGFDAFTKKHGFRFESANVFRKRFREFKEKAARAKLNYKMKLRNFLDSKSLSFKGFNRRLKSRRGLLNKNRRKMNVGYAEKFTYTDEDKELLAAHEEYDLRPIMNPVLSQMSCGSCWAFSTVAAIEAAYYKKHRVNVKLSEQVLIDCSWGYQNFGCGGGDESSAIDWIKANNGLPFHIDYGPYRAKNSYCTNENGTETVKVQKYKFIARGDIKGIQIALIKYGPVMASMHSSLMSFTAYRNGIYNDPECSTSFDDADHSVLIVGYGFDGPFMYWIIRNSWSKLWGEDGYGRVMAMNNACGLSNLCFVPIVE